MCPVMFSMLRVRSLNLQLVSDHQTFQDVLAKIANVEGWLTTEQARCLYRQATALKNDALIVEIGSFRGRSLIVLGCAAPTTAQLVSIDPHMGSDRGPQEIAANRTIGDEDHNVFWANLAKAGLAERINHIRKKSNDATNDIDGKIHLLYIDGAHRFKLARGDIKDWGNRVTSGGVMLIHDAFSSVGVTAALVTSTFVSSRWRYEGRYGSLALYHRQQVTGASKIANFLRQTLQLGWFARNVVIKAALVLKLYPLARLLGHTTRHWPY